MISIKFNGKTISEWIAYKRREKFVQDEVKPGKILVTWRDIDSMVYGWTLSADNEIELIRIAQLISEAKHNKLVNTIEGGTTNGKR